MQQNLIRGHQQHEQRHIFFLAEQPETPCKVRRQSDRLLCTAKRAIGLHVWSLVISEQLEDRRHRHKLLFPICKMRFINLAFKPFALPEGIIRILDWQLRKRR